MTANLQDLLRWAGRRLAAGGAAGDAGAVDAEALLSYLTGKSRGALLADALQPLPHRQAAEFSGLVERRARGEPIAYLTGQQEFWSLPLKITPDVLIPRADSELLVERVLAHAKRREIASILELGTGSGAIALALASEMPRCHIVATDISRAALAVAKCNQRWLAASGRKLAQVEFCWGSWFAAVPGRRFDLIVSNPPYVAAGDRHLQQGDVRFEPNLALLSPLNGLADLRQIIAAAPGYLPVGGGLLLECGYQQAAAVRADLKQHGFADIATYRDLGGIERVAQGLYAWGRGLPAAA